MSAPQHLTVVTAEETRRVWLPPLDCWRCPKCNTLLAKLRLTPGSYVEIKCAKCNTLVKEAA